MSRNQITFLPEQARVQKVHHTRIAFEQELFLYQHLQGTDLVPELLHHGEQRMELALVAGQTLQQAPQTVETFLRVAQWHIALQQAAQKAGLQAICLEDSNFQNFILSGSHVWGIDFEHWHFGSLAQAYALPLAHIHEMRCEPLALKEAITTVVYQAFCAAGADPDTLSAQIAAERALLCTRRKARATLRSTTAALVTNSDVAAMPCGKASLLGRAPYTRYEQMCDTLSMFDEVTVHLAPAECEPAASDAILQKLVAECQTKYLFVCGCESPLLTREALYAQFAQAEISQASALMQAQHLG